MDIFSGSTEEEIIEFLNFISQEERQEIAVIFESIILAEDKLSAEYKKIIEIIENLRMLE